MAPSSPRDNHLPEIHVPEACMGFRDFFRLVCVLAAKPLCRFLQKSFKAFRRRLNEPRL